MTENITHTAKFTAKASVLIVSAEICSRLTPGLAVAAVVTMLSLPFRSIAFAPAAARELPRRAQMARNQPLD
jgi:hypothetical protein